MTGADLDDSLFFGSLRLGTREFNLFPGALPSRPSRCLHPCKKGIIQG